MGEILNHGNAFNFCINNDPFLFEILKGAGLSSPTQICFHISQFLFTLTPETSFYADIFPRPHFTSYTVCPGSVRTLFFNFALQCHLLASCGVKILEVSAVAVYNFKAQASLHRVF
jgi:hypothetical protein